MGAELGDGVARLGRRTVAVTRAPADAPSWTAAVPTPPAAPWTRSRSPGASPAWVKIASCAVVKTSGVPPACGPVERVGHRHRLALVDRRELGLPAAADDGHDAVAGLEAGRARAERDDLAGELEPGDVLRRARRGGVHPARCMMSAPLSPAALTRTRISPLPGSGSGWSSTTISLSRIVTARMGPQSSTSAPRARGRPRRRSLGAMTLPDSTYKLEGISPRAFQHPADRAATAALQQVPYLDAVVRRLIELGYERAMRAAVLGSAVRLGQDQLPRIWVLEREVFHVLDLEDVPDLYLTQFPEANALTFGVRAAGDRPQLRARPAARRRGPARRDRPRGGARPERPRALHDGADDPAAARAVDPPADLRRAAAARDPHRAARVVARRGAELRPRRGARHARPDGGVPRPHDDLRRRGGRRAQPRRVHEAGARLGEKGSGSSA